MSGLDVTRTAAIVTGHSRGIGEAVATHLLDRGARVLGVSRKANDSLTLRFSKTLEEVQLDLADASSLARWLESDALPRFAARAETLLLVNNAGVLQPIGPPQMQDVELV